MHLALSLAGILLILYQFLCAIAVFTFAEDVAASGGYWLLCAGEKSYALRTSIVGSIGVISSTFGVMDLAQKLGIERRVWTAGEHKLPMDPFLPVTTDQEDRLTNVLHDLHKSFKDAVKSSRGDRLKIETTEKENDVFSGRVWTGNQAVEVGCIDGIGSVGPTMKEAFGDDVVLRLCSDVPQPGLRDFLGIWNNNSVRSSVLNNKGLIHGRSLEEAATAAARAAIEATVEEMEDMELWNRYKMCC
jgi:ClpP class serine protease